MGEPLPRGTMAEFMAHRETMDLTDAGKCTGCGQCCSDMLPLTNADVARIRLYIRRNDIRPISHVLAPFAGPSLDMVCPFMDEHAPDGRHCTIYPVRPAICRHFVCSALPGTEAERRMIQGIIADRSAAKGLRGAMPVSVRGTFFGKD